MTTKGNEPDIGDVVERRLEASKTAVFTVEQVDALMAQGARIEEILVDAVNAEGATRQAIIDDAAERSTKRFWSIMAILIGFAALLVGGIIDSHHHNTATHNNACANAVSINRVVDEDEATLTDARTASEKRAPLDADAIAFFEQRQAHYEAARPSLAGC